MTYYYLKTLHHLFVLIWISGLIYTSAIFVLSHKLVGEHKMKASSMGLNFWRYATWPSMILGMITGMIMLHLRLFHLADVWMQVKLVAVIILVAFHIRCHILYRRESQVDYQAENEESSKSPKAWAQRVAFGATLGVFFLFLMGLKDSFQWVSGTIIATVVIAIVGFTLANKT